MDEALDIGWILCLKYRDEISNRDTKETSKLGSRRFVFGQKELDVFLFSCFSFCFVVIMCLLVLYGHVLLGSVVPLFWTLNASLVCSTVYQMHIMKRHFEQSCFILE